MTSEKVRKKFLDFFSAKEHGGHKIVCSFSLIPDDPSVLLTTAGMQQFKKYYTGELDSLKDFHPNLERPLGSKNAVSIQKSFRTSDIDEVGDERHLTFFEMMGNFSFGGYFKKEAIEYAHKFLTEELGLDISYVTVFKGSHGVPKDIESKKIWNELGVMDIREETIEDVFWGPTGANGPCGPTTEIYCKNGAGEDVEIWNIVFNEYFCDGSREELENGNAKLTPLAIKGIDTGMGLERLMMVIPPKKPTVFETDLFEPLMEYLKKEFSNNRPMHSRRIIADHARSIVFLIADGVLPSNKDVGSILRILVRRAISHLIEFNLFDTMEPGRKVSAPKADEDLLLFVLKYVVDQYREYEGYEYLTGKKDHILDVVNKESEKFLRLRSTGQKLLEKCKDEALSNGSQIIPGDEIFNLYSTFGFPLRWIEDLTEGFEWKAGFDEAFKEHQKVSSAGKEKKFGGHGLILDTGELKAGNEEELKKVTRLHTATHLLHKALREVLGESVQQMGSDITPERTRFDFSFERKLTDGEKQKVEAIINENIGKSLPVNFKEMPKEEAEKTGALHFFREKYPDRVKIYYIGETLDNAISKEFCGGPHISNTSEIGHFKIIKEEAVGAGVRRVRGSVE